MKNSSETTGNQTRDLPACSTVIRHNFLSNYCQRNILTNVSKKQILTNFLDVKFLLISGSFFLCLNQKYNFDGSIQNAYINEQSFVLEGKEMSSSYEQGE
jgi:hypothetical protein